MTIPSYTPYVSFAGDGETLTFNLGSSFRFFGPEDLAVTIRAANGTETSLDYPADFSTSGGGGSTGSVILVNSVPVGSTLFVHHNQTPLQETDFVNNTKTDADVQEAALDRLTLGQQELKEIVGRTLRGPIGDDIIALPPAADRVGKILFFDDAGAPRVTSETVDLGEATVGTGPDQVPTNADLPSFGTAAEADIGAGPDNVPTNLVSSDGPTARLLSDRFSDVVNVKDYGALGDGTTDDSAAINAAITEALSGAQHKTVFFPAGDYRLDHPIVIEEIRGLVFRGSGGRMESTAPTVLQYYGDDEDAEEVRGLLQLRSVNGISFEDMAFRVRVADIETIVNIDALDAPVVSNGNTTFRRCSFLPGGATPTTEADVWCVDGKMAIFEHCVWNGVSETNLRIGDDPGNRPGTLQGGEFDNFTAIQCFFLGKVDLRFAQAWKLDCCVFGDDLDARVISSGDGLMMAGTVDACFFVSGTNNPDPAFVQGTGTRGTGSLDAGGIVIKNSIFRDYAVHVDVLVGYMTFDGNQFNLRNEGDIGIRIDEDADNVFISPSNDFRKGFVNREVAVLDNRTLPKDQIVSYAEQTTDINLTNGTIGAFENILEQIPPRRIRGGKYRVTLNAQIAAVDAARYRVKITRGGVDLLAASRTLAAGEDAMISATSVVVLGTDVTSLGATVRLAIQQDTGSSGALIRGASTSLGRTRMIVEELT